jgi:hypothetical protein
VVEENATKMELPQPRNSVEDIRGREEVGMP